MRLRNVLTLLFFTLSLFSFGGGLVEGFQYAAWPLIAPADFPAVHRAIDHQVGTLYVPFLFLSVPVTILLIWFHHRAMSRAWIVLAAVLQTYLVVATMVVAVPIQMRLQRAYSQPLVDKLIWFHNWLRLVPAIVHLIVVLILLYQVVDDDRTVA